MRLTLWLTTSMTGRQDDVAMVPADQGQLTLAPVRLSVSNIEFDDSCLGAEVHMHGSFTATSKYSLTRIERDGGLIGTAASGSLRPNTRPRGIASEYLCDSIPGWIAHVEKHEVTRGLRLTSILARAQGGPGSRRYHRVLPPGGALVLHVFVVGWSFNRLTLLQPNRPIFDLLRSSPEDN
jgi:hypothetical protein